MESIKPHGQSGQFLSNRNNRLYLEGGSLFLKYRFFPLMTFTVISDWPLTVG